MFMRLCRSVFLLLSLSLLPAADARASMLTFEWDGGGEAWVGADGFHLHPSSAIGFGIFDDLVFSTGPAVSVLTNGAGGHDYQFGDGLLTFYMGSAPVASIPVLPFVLSLSAPVHDQIWGVWGGATVARMDFLNLTLGSGTLDSDFAKSLGVSQRTLGGDVSFIVDDFAPSAPGACSSLTSTDPSFHCGVPNNIAGAIGLRAVPEPTVLALLAVGGAGLAIRRRVRRS